MGIKIFEDKLAMILKKLGQVKYLQVGGNDGVYADPFYSFLSENEQFVTSGVVLEPHPFYYKKLTENLSKFPQVKAYNIGVGNDACGFFDLYYIDHDDIVSYKLPTWCQGIASLSLDKNALGGNGCRPEEYELIRPHIKSIKVPLMPLREIVTNFKIAAPDIFLIDTEGYDWIILKQYPLDLLAAPKLILFEHESLAKDEMKDALNYLEKNNYDVIRDRTDTVCVLRGL